MGGGGIWGSPGGPAHPQIVSTGYRTGRHLGDSGDASAAQDAWEHREKTCGRDVVSQAVTARDTYDAWE